jgi:hypothetical protein
MLAQSNPPNRRLFWLLPRSQAQISDLFVGQARASPTNLFIQGALALWVIYGFHRGASNDLAINIDERAGWI